MYEVLLYFAIIDFFIVELNKQWKADAGDWLIAVSGIAALIPIFYYKFQRKAKFCCCFADFSRTYFHWIIYKLMVYAAPALIFPFVIGALHYDSKIFKKLMLIKIPALIVMSLFCTSCTTEHLCWMT